jgi:RNA polymerase sigma-70 factor (ECF subfamily)
VQFFRIPVLYKQREDNRAVVIDIKEYYEKYLPLVVRRCREMLGNEEDALDAAQDVFVKLVRAQKKLSGQFPSSLLWTIATNTCLNRLRWKKRRRETLYDDSDIPGCFAYDSGYDQVEAKLLMETILQDESESTRAICFMYHADGMTLKEIGETLGMSISGVRKRLTVFHARARIRYKRIQQ